MVARPVGQNGVDFRGQASARGGRPPTDRSLDKPSPARSVGAAPARRPRRPVRGRRMSARRPEAVCRWTDPGDGSRTWHAPPSAGTDRHDHAPISCIAMLQLPASPCFGFHIIHAAIVCIAAPATVESWVTQDRPRSDGPAADRSAILPCPGLSRPGLSCPACPALPCPGLSRPALSRPGVSHPALACSALSAPLACPAHLAPHCPAPPCSRLRCSVPRCPAWRRRCAPP